MRQPYPLALVVAIAVAAGCSAPATLPPAADPAAGALAPATTGAPLGPDVSALPATTEGAASPTAAKAARDPNRGFTPTDPAAVILAAGRPQLVEFYADW